MTHARITSFDWSDPYNPTCSLWLWKDGDKLIRWFRMRVRDLPRIVCVSP